jgi:uncharacterized GH25 family protein
VVYLSLTGAGPAGHADNATATCGVVVLPAFCQADASGQVKVAYQSATKAGAGSDTLTAALDPFGTDAATDTYTYPAAISAKVTGLSFDPSPIAPAASLPSGRKVKVSLAVLAAGGRPVPQARVGLTFTRAPKSDASVTGPGCSGAGAKLTCKADATGHVVLSYESSVSQVTAGSDGLQASVATSPKTSITAVDTYSYVKLGDLVWSAVPVAEAGTLGSAQKVPLTVTVHKAGGTAVVPKATVYLSLAGATGPAGHPDNAKATCGVVVLPAFCQADANGQVKVTYQSATKPGPGSDTLSAALDPLGTDAATDTYTYQAASTAKVTSLSFDPSPIAPATSLPQGKKVKVSLAVLAAGGRPVPQARVEVTLTRAPNSNASVTGPGCSGTSKLTCRADATGHIALSYESSIGQVTAGSDGLQASVPTSPTTAITAVDTYSYDKLGDLVWSTVPIAEAGTLGARQPVPLTVTVHKAGGTAVAPKATVYLSLAGATGPGGHVDNATARCGAMVLPAFCQADTHGQVQVTYRGASQAGPGSDTLTAALDPFGTDAATDTYTYQAASTAKVTGLSWDPSPIAPADGLQPGRKVKISLAVLSAGGRPVPQARAEVTFTRAPGSNASVTGTGCTGSSAKLTCKADATGHIAFTYVSSTVQANGGSDALQATVPISPKAAITAVDTYSYLFAPPPG